MKMAKKLILGAVAIAAMALTGCDLLGDKLKGDEKSIIKYDTATYDSGLGTWTVKGENKKLKDSDDPYIRQLNLLPMKKAAGITAVAKIKDQTANSKDGVIGVAFNVTENNENDTNDFILVGVRYDSAENKGCQYYVSYYANVTKADMNKQNIGAWTGSVTGGNSVTKESFDPNATECYEIELKGFTNISAEPDEDGTVTVVINVDALDDGGFNVNLYAADAYDAKKHVLIKNDDKSIKGTKYGETSIAAKKIGKTEKVKNGVGCYANVYYAKSEDTSTTLKGSLEVMDLTKSALEEVEE